MSLISKRTFRKWAKVLTERGLTVDDAELVAEVGNSIYVKRKPTPSEPIIVENGLVTFTVGAVWVNGTTYMFPSYPPGSTRSLNFTSTSDSDVLVYCYVPYQAVVASKPYTPLDPPGDDIPNWQVIRVDVAGDIEFDVIQESLVTPEYENTPSLVDPDTGACSIGWCRRELIRLKFDAELRKWTGRSEVQDPAGLIALSITSYAGNKQIDVTSFESLI